MEILKTVLLTVVVPGLISLVVFAAVWFKSQHRKDTSSHTWAGAVALGGAFCAAYYLLHGMPVFPPTEAAKWIVWIVVAVAGLSLISALFKLPFALVWLFRLMISFGFTWQILSQMIRREWTGEESMRWVGWLSIAIVVIWGFSDETAWRVRGAGVPAALTFATGALCLCLHWGSDPLLVQTGMILTASMAGAILPGILRQSFSLGSGAMPVYIMAYYSLLMCGHFYADMPLYSAAAFALVPLGPSCAMMSSLHNRHVWQNIVAVIGALIPAWVGLYFAYVAQLSTPK